MENDEVEEFNVSEFVILISLSSVGGHSSFAILMVFSAVRYLVKARLKSRKQHALIRAIDEGTLGKGSIAGDEYAHNMNEARVNDDGVSTWVETCFCNPPLAEERPYWEQYFELLSVKDAHSRRNCRHENGTEPWACCDCDCTERLEDRLQKHGKHLWSRCGNRGYLALLKSRR